ncbi:uncharacterized protein LOC135135625 [Zophobas morio]|uniref:uncharacterized protein LOC135135625 n=1 Tax=Zophobas morio TaxID=2755281 RepID=UPI0030827257
MRWIETEYEGMFQMSCGLIAFAEDLPIVIVDKEEKELKHKTEMAYRMVKSKVKELRLELAEHKTQAVLLQDRRKIKVMTLNLEQGGPPVRTTEEIRYLRDVTKRTDKTFNNLKSIMSNIEVPGSSDRKIIATVALSTLLYGCYRSLLSKTTGMMSIDLKVQKKCQVYERGKDHRQEIENKICKEWQNRWDKAEGETAGWTKKLIPDLQKWVNRKCGETKNYYVTQMLSGHGNFAKQTQRIGKSETSECWYECEEDDTAEHTLFACAK